MNNILYIITDQCGQLIACSHEIISEYGLDGELLPMGSGMMVNELMNPSEWFDDLGEGVVGPVQRDIYIKKKMYLMSAHRLHPGYTIHILRPDTDPAKVAGGQVMISCAEISHKLRNPLTSMKIVADLLPHYLPAGSFKETAVEVLNKQIGKLEAYTMQLEMKASVKCGE